MKRMIFLIAVVVAVTGFSGGNSAFAMRDPIGNADGMNLYQYAKSSPTSMVDPSGLTGLKATCQEPGKWLASPAIDFRVTVGNVMNPDEVNTAIAISAIIEFGATVPTSGTDLIADTVQSVLSGSGPKAGFPEGTIAVAQLINKIIKKQAYMWFEVQCNRCECDTGDGKYYWGYKHTAWHQCTFSDIDTGGKPKDWFGLNAGIVRDVGGMAGLIPMGGMTKQDFKDLKTACKWEAWFKSDEICNKKK